MKEIFTLLLTTLTFSICLAQFPIDSETGEVKYLDVVELPNLNKQEIYKKVKFWMVSTLKSEDNMVELEGSNSEQIIGTGNIIIDSIWVYKKRKNIYRNANLNFKFIVFIKDGKLRYSFENFFCTLRSGLQINIPEVKSTKGVADKKDKDEWTKDTSLRIHNKILLLIKNFKTEIQKKDDNDW